MRFPAIALILLLSLTLPACTKADNDKQTDKTASATTTAHQPAPPIAHGFMTVTPQQAQQLIASRKGLVMIDVRSQPELVEGVIKGSHNIAFWQIMQGNLNLPKDTPILVICAVGGRSYMAGQSLVKRGFQEVYNLKGGINDWKMAGLPLQ